MASWRPDPTFYPSPTLAMQAPPETLAYVALLNANGHGRQGRHRRRRHRPELAGLRPARRRDEAAQRRQRAAPLRLERVQLAPLSVRAERARRAALSRRAGHGVLAHPHPRHEARPAQSEAGEGDRSRRGGGEDRLPDAAHRALRSGRHLPQRARHPARQRPGRHLHARPRDVRDEGHLGARSRPAAPRLRLLVASRPRHDDLERVGHAEHGEGRRESRAAARRQVRARAARLGSQDAASTSRRSTSAPSSRWCSSSARLTTRVARTGSSAR